MPSTMNILSIPIGNNYPCFIVSEIGAMYENLNGMKKMIKASADAGADAVKVQTYRANTIAHPDSEFEFEDGSIISQFEFFKKYEISDEAHYEMVKYAKELGIIFFSTPSDIQDVDFLDSLRVPVLKTGSDDLTNYPFLEYIAKKGKPMIVSTGMSTLAEVEEAVHTILNTGNDQLALLHCTVSYPPDPEYVNLNVINTLQQAFDLPIGYSNHMKGIFPSYLAAAMGASIVEVHFTLDRTLKRPDYQVALEPAELKELVAQIRAIPVLEGSKVKQITETEKKWRRNARKSLIAKRDKKAGDILGPGDIKIMRPGTGAHPRYLQCYLGRELKKDLKENDIITFDAI